MATDYKSLVLGPAMLLLGEPFVFIPIKSQPNTPPMALTGIYTNRPVEIAMQDDGYISTNMSVMGVNLADFAKEPRQDDQVVFQNDVYDVWDVRKDGQGGADLSLRKATAR